SLQKQGASNHLISSLDDLAWLFNIRGKDVSYNPVVLSFALINQDHATLFTNLDKLSHEEKENLLSNGVEVLLYEAIEKAITNIPANSSIFIDPIRNCFAFNKLIPTSVKVIKDTNPTTN